MQWLPALYRSMSAAIIAVTFAACSSAPTVGTTSESSPNAGASATPASLITPDGVFIPPADRGKAVVGGLYLGFHDPMCCWLAPSSHIEFMKPPGARKVVVAVEVLDIPKFRSHPAFVDIAVANKTVAHRTGLLPGVSKIVVPLPASMQAGAGPFALNIRSSEFIPATENVTPDTRHLGVRLKSIEPA